MSSTTRNYVTGDNPMYRAVTPYSYRQTVLNRETGQYEKGDLIHGTRYAGPYATVGPAKANRGPGGWVEVCHPVWERLEE